MGEEGTLYALRMEASSPVSGGMNRSLNPGNPQAIKIEWDVINRTLLAGTIFTPLHPFLCRHCYFYSYYAFSKDFR